MLAIPCFFRKTLRRRFIPSLVGTTLFISLLLAPGSAVAQVGSECPYIRGCSFDLMFLCGLEGFCSGCGQDACYYCCGNTLDIYGGYCCICT